MVRLHGLAASLLVAVVAVSTPVSVSGGDKSTNPHAAHFSKCAEACTTCLRECESCAAHCAHLVAAGKKEHLRTLGTCSDCSEFCASAARIVSHNGPMMGLICDSCAKACDACAKECEKTASDAHMQRCAKACRDCATECRAMLKHVDAPATAGAQ